MVFPAKRKVSGHDFSRAEQASACVKTIEKKFFSSLPQAGAQLPLLERSVINLKIQSSLLFILAVTLLFLFIGCRVGPNYHRPSVPAAPAWKEQPPWRASDPKDSIPKGAWWTIFGDPELNQYETQALKANQTIEIARNQLEQARASARITQSGLFPQASAGFSAQRSLISANRPAN